MSVRCITIPPANDLTVKYTDQTGIKGSEFSISPQGPPTIYHDPIASVTFAFACDFNLPPEIIIARYSNLLDALPNALHL